MQEESAAAVINPYPAGKTAFSAFHLAGRAAAPSGAGGAAGAGAVLPLHTSPATSPAAGWAPQDPSEHPTESREGSGPLPGPCWATSGEAVSSKVRSSQRARIRKKPFTGEAEVAGSDSAVPPHRL